MPLTLLPAACCPQGLSDKGLRPRLGEVLHTRSDFVILTNDNPHREDPGEIVQVGRKSLRHGWSRLLMMCCHLCSWSPWSFHATPATSCGLDTLVTVLTAHHVPKAHHVHCSH